MNRDLNDEQIDKMMRSIVCDASADDSMTNKIADSPTVWWAVQRNIDQQKAPWPPVKTFWRLLAIGVPVAAAVVIAFSLFSMLPTTTSEKAMIETQPSTSIADVTEPVPSKGTEPIPVNEPVTSKKNVESAVVRQPARRTNTRTVATARTRTNEPEIKTDFIALSYARNPDSGQIVRVKVPSSMMVSLGLVSTVEKPSNLVDAEVLVGDDGLTRAIRFIR